MRGGLQDGVRHRTQEKAFCRSRKLETGFATYSVKMDESFYQESLSFFLCQNKVDESVECSLYRRKKKRDRFSRFTLLSNTLLRGGPCSSTMILKVSA